MSAFRPKKAEIAKLEGDLADPQVCMKIGAGMPQYLADIEAKKAALEAKFSRWAELEEIKAAAA